MPARVVARLDDGADQPRHADPVGAHLHRDHAPVRPLHPAPHGLGILGAEEENVADLDAARGDALVRRHLGLEAGGIVLLVGRRVGLRPLLDDGREVLLEVDVGRWRARLDEVGVAVDPALPGLRQDDELVAQVAADGPRIRRHGDRLEPHARERAQVGDEHLVVGVARRLGRQVEGVGVLHEELAPAHDAEAGPHLVAELPLDVIEVARQVAIGLHAVAEDLRDQLLVGRPVQHLAVVPVLEAQHLRAVGVVALALAPDVGRLHRGHQHFHGAGAVLLLAHDLLDLLEHAEAQGKPGIDAGARLADHAAAQHQLMRDDLRLFRRLAQDGQEETGEAHGCP